jgi:hypothetical protein
MTLFGYWTGDRWVFVLLGVERGKHDYVVIKPRELSTAPFVQG